MGFQKDFVWGAAAASYQIEGGATADDKGLSVWDMMCREPGRIWGGDTGDTACDHYHRYEEDARLMGEIGLKAYRLSISWPRVIPDGTGSVNKKGVSFYDKLIDSLLENGVEPWVTLFHWDYPYALFCRDGWLNRDSADWFAEYTQVIVDNLSDRVSHWITLNEPQSFIVLGHQIGSHAPGLKLGFSDVLLAAHHVLLAHGKAVQVIRSRARSETNIGAAPVGDVRIPFSEDPDDIEAARKSMFSITSRNCFCNTWFADPMILGKYPDDGLRIFRGEMPEIRESDMEIISQPLDFYGVNVYVGQKIQALVDGGSTVVQGPVGPALTAMEWPIMPEVLYWGPRFFYERYNLPIVVTESGMANLDWIHVDGRVHDPQRIDYISRHLAEYARAINDGVDCRGYFLWTIMDNFEWDHGFKSRFGIIFVDYATGKRTLKDSAYWYRDVIASNGDILSL